MASKVGSLIGSETRATFWLSINNTRTTLCASNTVTRTRIRRKHLCGIGGICHFARPPSFTVLATSNPNSNSPNSSSPSPSPLQDNLIYLLKLGIGSVLGAALIKYGSAAVPGITRPDITLALLMISTPPVIAVLLLVKESRNV